MPDGSCLCGAVCFTILTALAPLDACHCSHRRKQSGHYWASTDVPRPASAISGSGNLRWYAASERVRRGSCGTCGSFLFWDPIHRDRIAVAMGAIDAPTGTALHMHIHVADKGECYAVADGVPLHE